MPLTPLGLLACGVLAAILVPNAGAQGLPAGLVCQVPILVDDADSFSYVFNDSTLGALEQTTSPACGVGISGTSAWYRYGNTSNCERDFELVLTTAAKGQHFGIEVYDTCGVPAGPCAIDPGSNLGPLSISLTIPAKTSVFIRVWTEALDTSFTLSMTGAVPNGPDGDGDGVPDCDDVCIGDDTVDVDGDGIPDDCDWCFLGTSEDCDQNGVDDLCDISQGSVLFVELFNDEMMQPATKTTGLNYTPTFIDNALRIGEETDSQVAANVLFEPVAPTVTESVEISFHARAEPTPGSSLLTLVIYDADTYPSGTPVTGAGSADGLVAGIVKTPNGSDNLNVSYLGVPFASAPLPFDIDDGQWREYILRLEDGQLWAWHRMSGQAAQALLTDVAVPGYSPFRARFGLGVLSTDGLFDHEILVDQVVISDDSLLFDRDIDGNGGLDACESAPLSINGSANPFALLPTVFPSPSMGNDYTLAVEHVMFLPDALVDFLWISAGTSIDVPIPPSGTLHVSWPPLVQLARPAGDPFAIPIPYDVTLFDVPLTFQSVSWDPALGDAEFQFTNSLETAIGGWRLAP